MRRPSRLLAYQIQIPLARRNAGWRPDEIHKRAGVVSLNAATIEILIAKGLSAADILDVARATEVKADPTNAARQARHRARKRNGVTVTPQVPLEDTSTLPGTDLPDDAIASPPPSPRQPVSEAMDFWNENAAAAGWRTMTARSAARQKATASRLREHGLDGWKTAIARARASPFLGGADPPGWFTFDFFVKAGNFIKVIEGNYDRRHIDNSDPTAVALSRLHAQFGGDVGAFP